VTNITLAFKIIIHSSIAFHRTDINIMNYLFFYSCTFIRSFSFLQLCKNKIEVQKSLKFEGNVSKFIAYHEHLQLSCLGIYNKDQFLYTHDLLLLFLWYHDPLLQCFFESFFYSFFFHQ
jgi:hypothetical protein